MATTEITQHVRAPRSDVYAALIDPDAIATWRVPDGMTSRVHEFDAREGGTFRVSLTYESPTDSGKSSAQTDTYHGRFVRLVDGELVVEASEFETDDPGMRGEMTMTTTLADADGPDGGTTVSVRHDGLPPGVDPADNETGTRMALAKLARLVEGHR